MDQTQGQEAVNTMTQDVFNWMARSVNKDFVQLGYPTILTKKGGRDFVSLCALMQNCSTLLAVVRAKGASGTSALVADQDDTRLSTTAAVAALDPSVIVKSGKASRHHQHSESHQKKRNGLFSSSKCFKQLQASNAESHAKMNAKAPKMMQFEREEFTSVYEGIVDSVRRDTELIITETRCLGAELVLPGSGDQHLNHNRQLTKDQIALYFATRWVQFKEAVIQRLLEGNRLAIELQALRPFPVKCSTTAITRSKSASGDTAVAVTAAAAADMGSDSCGFGSESLACSRRSHHGRSSRQRSQSHVSVTKIPSLEAEIRRLKLELTRRDQRHKEEADRHAKERERMSRDLRMAQRRSSLGAPRWSGSSTQQVQQQHQQHDCDCSDQQAIPEILQTLDSLAESLGGGAHQSLTSPTVGSLTGSLKSFSSKQQQHQAYVDRVCSSILTRVQGIQADCNTSRRRQADLEVLISILKARLDLTNDQLSDVGKFESAVNDIARKMVCCDSGGIGGTGGSQQNLQATTHLPVHQQSGGGGGSGGSGNGSRGASGLAHGCGDEHRDSLVSRLTSRLRERQRPV